MCCFFLCAGGGTSTSSCMLHNSNMHILAFYSLFSRRSHCVFPFFLFVQVALLAAAGITPAVWAGSCRLRALPHHTFRHGQSMLRSCCLFSLLLFSCLSFGVLPSSPTVIIARLFVCSPAAGPHGEAAQINSLPWQAARLLYIPPVWRLQRLNDQQGFEWSVPDSRWETVGQMSLCLKTPVCFCLRGRICLIFS